MNMSFKYKFRPSDMNLVLEHYIGKYGEETTLKKFKEDISNYPDQPIFFISKSMMGKTKIKWY